MGPGGIGRDSRQRRGGVVVVVVEDGFRFLSVRVTFTWVYAYSGWVGGYKRAGAVIVRNDDVRPFVGPSRFLGRSVLQERRNSLSTMVRPATPWPRSFPKIEDRCRLTTFHFLINEEHYSGCQVDDGTIDSKKPRYKFFKLGRMHAISNEIRNWKSLRRNFYIPKNFLFFFYWIYIDNDSWQLYTVWKLLLYEIPARVRTSDPLKSSDIS